MKISQIVQPAVLLAIGLLCASVLMLTRSPAAAMSHGTDQEQSVQAPVATQLPTVVVIGKRMSPVEKAKYQHLLKASAATLV